MVVYYLSAQTRERTAAESEAKKRYGTKRKRGYEELKSEVESSGNAHKNGITRSEARQVEKSESNSFCKRKA